MPMAWKCISHFCHPWTSNVSSSKLAWPGNLASISSRSSKFTTRSVSPFKVVSLATKPPWHDQSSLSFLKFDFLTKPPDSGGWGKHLNTNISKTRQWWIRDGKHAEVTPVQTPCHPISTTLLHQLAKGNISWSSYLCSREQMGVILKVDLLP